MKLRVNPDFRAEKLDDETLLYSIKDEKGIYLNSTANIVWELCLQLNSAEQIIEYLVKAYPQQADSIGDEVQAAINSLIESNALIPDNE